MEPAMKTFRLILLSFGLFMLTSCGGSGSSGFDAQGGIQGILAVEQTAIDQVTKEGGCVSLDEIILCAPDMPESSLGVAEPDDPPALSITPKSGSMILCHLEAEAEHCEFTVTISPRRFPPGTQFFVAVRFQDETSFWTTGLHPFDPSMLDMDILELIVRIRGILVEDFRFLQIAVLVFNPETDLPTPVVGELLLRDFKTDMIYVVKDIMFEIVEEP